MAFASNEMQTRRIVGIEAATQNQLKNVVCEASHLFVLVSASVVAVSMPRPSICGPRSMQKPSNIDHPPYLMLHTLFRNLDISCVEFSCVFVSPGPGVRDPRGLGPWVRARLYMAPNPVNL